MVFSKNNTFIKGILIFGLSGFMLGANAGSMGYYDDEEAPRLWTITASLGATKFEDMYENDGETPFGRFAIGYDFQIFEPLSWGIELGIQSGNTMRYYPSDLAVNTLGGLPIQTQIKPIIDALLTLRTEGFSDYTVYGILKAGLAHRRWQMNDRNSILNLSKTNGEIQLGLGCAIAENARVSLVYQGIYSSDIGFTLNAATLTADIENIPEQHGIMLGLSILL